MKRNKSPNYFARPVFLALAVLILAGCISDDEMRNTAQVCAQLSELEATFQHWVETNPCGVLEVRKPLLNVTGHFTEIPQGNPSLLLFTAPNTTLESALYVTQNCPPIQGTSVDTSGRFTFESLPAGVYVVALPARAFSRRRGVPVVDEFDSLNHTLEFGIYGGNSEYSLATFEIRRRTKTTS